MSDMPTSIVKRRSLSNRKASLLRFFNRLLKHFGPRFWWPAEHAWEMMVGAILTQNTAWTNVEKALDALRTARALSVKRMATLPRQRLEKLIHPAGFFRQKAGYLQTLAQHLLDHPEFHKQIIGQTRGNLPELRARLLALKGVGPETADSMLLYAGNYPIFVVDAYTRRIGQRHGWFKFDDYQKIQDFFQDVLPKNAALYNEFHALIVELAKTHCKSQNPLCSTCPVRLNCAFALKRKKAA